MAGHMQTEGINVPRTKTVATVGPASRDPDVLGRMIDEGVDVLRINFSHGTLDEHARVLETIRDHGERTGAIVAVLGDLCGPKIRVGDLDGDAVTLTAGETLVIQRQPCTGTAERFSTNYDRLIDEAEIGARVLLDDGKLMLVVIEKRPDELVCTCRIGGKLRSHKGVNLPDTDLSVPALTDKDRLDLDWAINHELDYIALSFVRRPEDLYTLRKVLKERESDMRIISKIEKPEAIEHLAEIIDASDAVLVARGDLGVEMDVARVPLLQKDITLRCRRAGKPVIIATQMLESMIESATPTRAEVSDVANAILDATDAVMLSAETAIGAYPLEAVRFINRIANETEGFSNGIREPAPRVAAVSARVAAAVAQGASLLASELSARLVVVWTRAGNMPRLLAKQRFNPPIVGLSPDPRVCRRMALHYGVLPIRMQHPGREDLMLRQIEHSLLERNLTQPHDLIVVAAGTHFREGDAANALLIHFVNEPSAE
jgi:pyruvate kinase